MMAMPISISQAAPAGGGRMPPGPGPQLVPQVTVPWPSDVQKTIGGVQYLFKWHDVPIDEFAAHEPGQQVAAGWVSDHGGHVVLIPHLTVMTWGLLPPPTALPPTPPTVTSGMFG